MKEANQYDIAIVGGGLAGLSLAIQAAGKNYSTILFEKESYPFHKVCGEYISLESWEFLKRLGVDLEVFQLPIIDNLTISDTYGNLYPFKLPLGGFGISRFTLDNELYKIAVSKGVEVNTETKVDDVSFDEETLTIQSSKKIVQAKVVAGCYGKRSNLDIKWRRSFTQSKNNALNNYIGIKYHVKYDNDASQIALHNFHNGYCGLSKIEDDKSCLCYLTTAQNLRDCNNSIKGLEENVLYRNHQLKNIFRRAEFLYKQPLAISQISFSKKSQVQDHVLMLGDAAGLITPLCGNGMSMAMHASKIAFHHIDNFLSGDISRQQLEGSYAKTWKQEFAKRLWIGRTVQRFFGENKSTSAFLKTMKAIPPLAKWIIEASHGEPF